MSNAPTDLNLLVQLDQLCDEFEVLCEQGQSPQITDFLPRIEVSHRGKLLQELVGCEIRILEAQGHKTSVEEMLRRYESLAPSAADREALRATIEKAIGSTANTEEFQAASTGTFSGDTDAKGTEFVLSEAVPLEVAGFKIESVLGKGGMGIVYKAVQTSLRRTVALKMVLDAAAATPEHFERFEREARAVAELNDPHFVQIYEFGQTGGRPYMALEFVAGGSLEKHRQGEPQPSAFTARTVEVLARAMHKAHAIGLVHRDLKPHNVLLTGDGTPKIADFGLVKRQDADESQMTQDGLPMGTASYMSPEQTHSPHDVGPAADVYALGAILYCLLTGRPPFLGARYFDTIRAVRETEPVPPSRLRPDTPQDLEVICLACLEKEPHKRYATAADLAADLRRYLDGHPITRRPVSRVERTWRWAKRNPLGATVAGLVVAIAVIASSMSWGLMVTNNRLETQTERANRETTRATTALRNEEQERAKAVVAQVAKSEQYNEVLWAYHRVLYNADTLLRDTRRDVAVRKRLIEIAMEELEKVRDLGEKNTLFDRNQAIGYERLGDIYLLIGEPKNALQQYDSAYGVIEKLVRKDVKEPVHYRNLAVYCNHQAEALERLGETVKAEQKWQEGLRLHLRWEEMLREQRIDHAEAKKAVAESYVQLAAIDRRLGDIKTALEHLTLAREWYSKLPERDAAEGLCFLDYRLGEAHHRLGNENEAERLLSRFESSFAKVFAAKTAMARLLASHIELGTFYLLAKRDPSKAWTHYQPALDTYQGLWEQDKGSALKRDRLAAIEYRVGGLLVCAREQGIELQGVPGGNDPQTHFERSRALREQLAATDPGDMQAKIEWALALARCGRAKEAEEHAESLVEKGQGNPRLLSQAAATFALCSEAKDEETQARCRRRAYEVLDQLVDAGWKDRVVLRDDPDFDPIRREPRYQKLLESLPPPARRAGDAPAAGAALDAKAAARVGKAAAKVAGSRREPSPRLKPHVTSREVPLSPAFVAITLRVMSPSSRSIVPRRARHAEHDGYLCRPEAHPLPRLTA